MDDRLFRTAMGKFATGVTVITTNHEGDVHGMTANAFMSVSLSPELVVISIKENARMLSKIEESGHFVVNILAVEQEKVSMLFAGQLKGEDYHIDFEDLAGFPAIPGVLAQVACEVSTAYVEGDHTLFIGRVKDIRVKDGAPLVFFDGRYSRLEETAEVQ